MAVGGNGPVGVVLVWVIVLTLNAISYLTAFDVAVDTDDEM